MLTPRRPIWDPGQSIGPLRRRPKAPLLHPGLFDKYEKAVMYDDLPAFVEQDRRARRFACQETLSGLEQLKRELDNGVCSLTLT